MRPGDKHHSCSQGDPPSCDLIVAVQEVLEWAKQMGGWEAPCWERLSNAEREAASKGDGSCEAQQALRHIHDVLYLDAGPEGEFHNPDKTWNADTLDLIAKVVREHVGERRDGHGS